MRVFEGADELRAAAGEVLGTSDWMLVDQARIDAFADASDDHQWIHVNPQLAAAGPFGRTVAHGLLTLSLVPAMHGSIFRVHGARLMINYGLNKVRYPAPVPSGSKVRGTATLVKVEAVEGGVQATLSTTVEVEGSAKPVCVCESVLRLVL
ncbi:MAG: MaoC family dehydratase [Candidatus Dormibacteraceae bacterium]